MFSLPPSRARRAASTNSERVLTYSLVVDDLDDGSQAAGVGAVALEQDDAANLNEAPVGCNDRGLTHFVGLSRELVD